MLLRESTPPAEPARVIHTAAREYEYTLCSFGSFSIVSYLVPVWRIACTFAGIVKGSWLSRLHHRGSPSHVLPSNTTIHATSRGGQSIQTCDWRTYYSPSQYRDWQVPSRANLWKEKDRKVGEGGSAPSAGGVSTLSSHTSLIRNSVLLAPGGYEGPVALTETGNNSSRGWGGGRSSRTSHRGNLRYRSVSSSTSEYAWGCICCCCNKKETQVEHRRDSFDVTMCQLAKGYSRLAVPRLHGIFEKQSGSFSL